MRDINLVERFTTADSERLGDCKQNLIQPYKAINVYLVYIESVWWDSVKREIRHKHRDMKTVNHRVTVICCVLHDYLSYYCQT